METVTKKYVKNFGGKVLPYIITPIATIVLAIIFGDRVVIDNYCGQGNVFLSFLLGDTSLCSYIVVLSYIVITLLGLFVTGLLISILFDAFAWIFKLDGKTRIQDFKSKRSNYSEIIITDSGCDNVAGFILQYLRGFRSLARDGDIKFSVNNTKYYDPKKHNTLNHIFIVNGNKLKTKHSTNETIYSMTEMPEMFFITVIQGSQSTTQVKIENDDEEIFPLIVDAVSKELRKVFSLREKRKSRIY